MTPSDYSEDALVEQPAISLLNELGWEIFNAYSEFDQVGGSALGRETKGEVVLTSRLRPALEKLNPDVPAEAIAQAIEELTRDRSRMSLAAANREVYRLLKNGVRVRVANPKGGGEKVEVVRVIDWNDPKNNDFLLCSQFWVTGEMYTRRADLVGFVNGLPLVFIELKATHRRLETAYTGNLTDYKDTIPHLFWYNALIILSNGSESRVGSVTAGWEHLSEWKKVGSEAEEGRVSLETMLRGTCEPARLLDLIENFCLFMEAPGGLIKLLAKNHQYLGVNNALVALREIKQREGRLGVFWHTQGSGKSISMIFFSQKVLRKMLGHWSFVIVTDRTDLDDQIYKNFASTGVVTEKRKKKEGPQATSSAHLRRLLREDHRYVFTLIHKFRTEPGETHPVLSERDDVIVITDEAHRTQYDTLALNMRTALPNASFLAFTGTPLIVGEEKTRDVFGDYISVYDFRQSVQDKATVPLYYENRIPELQLTNENLNEDMERLLEEAELDDEQEKKLEREFARQYHLITRDDRLEAVGKDIVEHFTGRGFQGKAMVVCIDKATAVRMYDRVQKHWGHKLDELRQRLAKATRQEERLEIEAKIAEMEKTDMAVVVSQSQNEIRDLRAKGADIRPHRRRIVQEDLANKFKDPDDPFRLVFVCAMWMTGFDAPSCSTIYLDKPMRDHTLMQTIARANRVFPDKVSGLIVDYVGVFRNLERALAIYGAGGPGDGKRPVEDKAALVALLKQAIKETKGLCKKQGISFKAIQAVDGFDRIELLDDAVDALVASDNRKKRYLDHAANVQRLYKAVLPDPAIWEVKPDCQLIHMLSKKIRALSPPADISKVTQDVEYLLDQSIATEGYIISESGAPDSTNHLVDLSAIDFEALKERFESGHRHSEIERVKGMVARKLKRMVRLNRTRMDYMERFQKMIDEYNAGSVNTDEFFRRLVEFAQSLNEEEQRAVGERLTEEELALFDLLTKPEMQLSAKERAQVKKTARELLETLKREKLVLDWRKRQQTRAQVRVAIETILDQGLPDAYSRQIYAKKMAAVFQHVYDCYFGAGQSVYSVAA
jgi:type I restriction enzyme R subunit